jgi:hypothetical protein
MDEIKVDKDQLIETLRRNRDEHQEIFDKAQIAYRDAMVAELDRALEEARTGGKIQRAFNLPIPENHVADFDTAIEMLQWDKGKTVKLSMREFKQYVENEWGWQQAFIANTASYLAQ